MPTGGRTSAKLLTLAVLLALAPRATYALTTTTYIGTDQGLWSDPLNWDNGLPSNSTFDVTISTAAPLAVQLDASETIHNLTLAAPDSLAIQTSKTLTLSGGTLSNDGSILLTGASSSLLLTANTILTGAGSVLLSDSSSILTGTSGLLLTNNNVISGQGIVGNGVLRIANSGTITASGGLLQVAAQLVSNAFVNSGIMRADGGSLYIGNSSLVATNQGFNNSGGLIEAQANSNVTIHLGGVFTGGTISSAPGGTVTSFASTSPGIRDVTFVGANNYVSGLFGGTITNSGTLTTGLVSFWPTTGAPMALTGNGTILMSTPGSFVVSSSAGFSTFSNDNTIRGQGTIDLMSCTASTSTGLIVADSGQMIVRNLTNNGTIRADGGLLFFQPPNGAPLSIRNSGGIIEAVNNSHINIGTTIDGGIIRTLDTSSATIQTNSAAITISNASISTAAQAITVDCVNFGNILLLNDTFNGNISLSSGGGIISLQDVANFGTINDNVSTSLSGDHLFLKGNTVNNGTWNLSGKFVLQGTITNHGSLNFATNSSITVPAALPLINTGIITLSLPLSPSNNGTLTLSGGGSVVLMGGLSRLGSAQVALFSDNVISGSGALYLSANSGTVTATPTLASTNMSLSSSGPGSQAHTLTNTGVIGANGATLSLNAYLVNTAGTITSKDHSLVSIQGTIVGGLIQSDAINGVLVFNATLQNLTTQGSIQINTGNVPDALGGTIQNMGVINIIRVNSSFSPTVLVDADTHLAGVGTVTLSSQNLTPAQLAANTSGTAKLTNDNTIMGWGILGGLHTQIINSGTIIANASAGITLSASTISGFTSSGVLRADAAPLTFQNSIYTVSGALEAVNGGILNLNAGIFNITCPISLSNSFVNFNSTSPNAHNFSSITGTGTVTHGTNIALPLFAAHADPGTLTFANTDSTRQTPAVLLNLSTLTLSPAATLDITNHDAMIGNTSLTTIQAQILHGFNKAGIPTDPAITSSTSLASGATFLVPIDADQLLGDGTPGSAIGKLFDGTAITQPSTVLLKYTLLGDLTLDGTVDALDLASVASHYGESTPGQTNIQLAWLQGDFNLDGTVDALDFSLMTANLGQSLSQIFTPAVPVNQSPVPEPATLILLALPTLLLLSKRTLRTT